jgi:predicted dehydrogenase
MALPALKMFDSVAISHKDTPSPEALSAFTYFDDPDHFFESGCVESIYVATPVNLHKRFVIKAAAAGIPVLVEKPLCLSIQEGDELASLKFSKIAVAFRKRFSQAAKAVCCLRRADAARPCEIEYLWLTPFPRQNWRLSRAIGGGGVLMDIGSHIIDLFEHCVGRITDMQIQRAVLDNVHSIECLMRFSCAFEDRSTGRVHIGWAKAESIQKMEFRQGDSTVSWIYRGEPTSQLTTIEGATCNTVVCDRLEDYCPMFNEFRAFAQDKPNSLPLLGDGIRNMVLMNKLYGMIYADRASNSASRK